WKVRTEKTEPLTYSVRLVYHPVGGTGTDDDIVRVFESTARTIVVGPPWAELIKRRIDFSALPGAFTTVVLDVSYDDGEYRTSRRVELDGSALAPTEVELG